MTINTPSGGAVSRVRRGAAAIGGLAVLLAGVSVGVASPALAATAPTASTSVSSTAWTSLGVTSARDSLGPVARTGGAR